jgi:hypothetical protein
MIRSRSCPPHSCCRSGCAPSGIDGHPNAFALGDTTNILISKAGSTAHFEAEALAENLASIVKIGSPVRDYDGKVFCLVEAGKDRAIKVTCKKIFRPVLLKIHYSVAGQSVAGLDRIIYFYLFL